MKLVFGSAFEADFAELIGYLHENGGPLVSQRFEASVVHLVELLLQNPELGRVRRGLKPEGIRSFVVPEFRNYVLFYRLSGEELVLMRVRFGGMNLPTLFRA